MTRQGINTATLDALCRPTPPEEVKQRQGPGGRMLDYVDARFVMDRLDEIGQENWRDEFLVLPNGSVQCGLSILVDGEWITKFDVGDPSDIEPTKGAYSEALKRAAVKWGIARDLYGHTTSGRGGVASSSAPRPAPAPRQPALPPAGGSVPDEPDYVREAAAIFGDVTVAHQDAVATKDGFCPDHGLAWVLRPGGHSKTTGKPYDAFWSCPSTDRPFCKQKPGAKWTAMHEVTA